MPKSYLLQKAIDNNETISRNEASSAHGNRALSEKHGSDGSPVSRKQYSSFHKADPSINPALTTSYPNYQFKNASELYPINSMRNVKIKSTTVQTPFNHSNQNTLNSSLEPYQTQRSVKLCKEYREKHNNIMVNTVQRKTFSLMKDFSSRVGEIMKLPGTDSELAQEGEADVPKKKKILKQLNTSVFHVELQGGGAPVHDKFENYN